MNFTHEELSALRAHHPAWRLLCARRAPFIMGFLYRTFIAAKARSIDARELAETLESELATSHTEEAPEAGEPSTSAMAYLEDWASPQKGWLRKFYRQGTDEVQFDLAPAAEKAIAWLGSLSERAFVGTESRLRTITAVLKQMAEGTETDPEKRIEELQRQRDALDMDIAAIRAGTAPLLDEVQLQDRWQHFEALSLSLLHDFREVEDHFRQLDRRARERIAAHYGPKAELLDEILGERDAIRNSEQGRSFRAFFRLLMSNQGREELTGLLRKMLAHPAIEALGPDPRISELMADCLTAAAHAQGVSRQLSEQIERLLMSGAFTESRRIAELLHGIETSALALRSLECELPDTLMDVELPALELDLPLERPLFTPPAKLSLDTSMSDDPEPEADLSLLFAQVSVEPEKIREHINEALEHRIQVTLNDVLQEHPITQGLPELIMYLQLSVKEFQAIMDEDHPQLLTWNTTAPNGSLIRRTALVPRVILTRKS